MASSLHTGFLMIYEQVGW